MKKFILTAALLIAGITAALSQSNPGLFNGQVPTAAQWNSYFSAKQDYSPVLTNVANGTSLSLRNLSITGSVTGAVTVGAQAATGTYNFNLPTAAGTASYLLTSQGGGSSAMTWTSPTIAINGVNCSLAGSCSITAAGITVGSTVIASGTNTRVEYNNSGVLGEYSISGSGNVAMTTSPAFTTPSLGVATATSINGNTITTSTGTLTLGAGKTFTSSNSLTLTATDGSTLAIGTGGTLGSNAYTSTAYAPLASPTFTGTVTAPSLTLTGPTQTFSNAAFNNCSSLATISNVLTCGTGGGNALFGTITGNVANDIVTMSNTTVGVQDSGTALSSLATVAAANQVNRPSFSAHLNGDYSVPNTSINVIPFGASSTVDWDTNGDFNITNYHFIASVAGYYKCSATVAFSGTSTAGALFIVQLLVNGSIPASKGGYTDILSGGTASATIGSGVVDITAYLNGTTDYVEVAESITGTVSSISIPASVSQFSCFKLAI